MYGLDIKADQAEVYVYIRIIYLLARSRVNRFVIGKYASSYTALLLTVKRSGGPQSITEFKKIFSSVRVFITYFFVISNSTIDKYNL